MIKITLATGGSVYADEIEVRVAGVYYRRTDYTPTIDPEMPDREWHVEGYFANDQIKHYENSSN